MSTPFFSDDAKTIFYFCAEIKRVIGVAPENVSRHNIYVFA